jgi:SAM-dependent methyltransferase
MRSTELTMNRPNDPHFDRFAREYRDLHRQSVRMSGEDPDYFAAYKIACMTERLGTDAARRPLDILDFGCGVGESIPYLQASFPGARVHGADVSGESLALASSAHPDASFARIEQMRLPLPDHSIDVALAACVYHHIAPEERGHWTRELRRVLRPNGHCFIFEHNPLNPLTQRVVRDCPFDDDAILLPRRETLDLLAENGFTDRKAGYIVFFPKALAFLRPLERLMSKLPLGAQYFVQARA